MSAPPPIACSPVVTVWPSKFVKGTEDVLFDDIGRPCPMDEDGANAPVLPAVAIGEAFARRYTTDAHFVPYVLTDVDGSAIDTPRVNRSATAKLEAVGLSLAFFTVPIDIDDPVAHGTGEAASDAWREALAVRLGEVETTYFFKALTYDTRGGARFIGVLSAALRTAEYLELLAGLRHVMGVAGIVTDRLIDVQRCYRLPFVVRDGKRQERPARLEYVPLSEDAIDVLRGIGREHPLRAPVEAKDAPTLPFREPGTSDERPGDWMQRNVAWRDVLAGHGWQFGGMRGSQEQWYRPGKPPSGPPSALTNKDGTDRLFVLTTNGGALENERYYDKLGAFARLEGLSMSDAARVARERFGMGLAHVERDTAGVEAFVQGAKGSKATVKEVEAATVDRPTGTDRRRIEVKAAEHGRMMRDAIDAFEAGGRLYQRMETLCFWARDTKGRLAAKLYERAQMHNHLGDVADWYVRRPKKAAKGELSPGATEWEDVPAAVPEKLALSVLVAKDVWMPRARPLAGIVDAPFIRVNGEIVEREGYDAKSEHVLDYSGDVWPSVLQSPTKADAQAALDVVCDIISNFPFATPADKAACVAYFCTALCRMSLKSSLAFIFDSATPGTGKGKLVHIGAILATGAHAPVSPELSKPDDLQKWITSMLVSCARIVLIDNITHRFGSGAFDAAMTAEGDWSDRLLGKSEIVSVPNRALWTITGRNVQTKGDSFRRALRIRLETDLERPDLRSDLRYEDIDAHVVAHRHELVVALLTIMRAYVVAGRPAPLAMSSYRDWSRLVREPLVWLGMADPVDTQEALRISSNGEIPQLAEFMAAWDGCVGDMPKTLAEVVELARPATSAPLSKENKRLAEAIIELTGLELHDRKVTRVLADAVGRNAGRKINGYTMNRDRKSKTGVRWVVTVAAPKAAQEGDLWNF